MSSSSSEEDPFAEEAVSFVRSPRSTRRSNRDEPKSKAASPRQQDELSRVTSAHKVAAELKRKQKQAIARPVSPPADDLFAFLQQAGVEDAYEELDELCVSLTELKTSREEDLLGVLPEACTLQIIAALKKMPLTVIGRQYAPKEQTELLDFLDGCGVADALALFEAVEAYWPFLQCSSREELLASGIDPDVLAPVILQLEQIPETAIGAKHAAKNTSALPSLPVKKKRVVNLDSLATDVDFESLTDLPALPTEAPPISDMAAYKRFMRLRYEYQRREAELRSPKPSPRGSPRGSPRPELKPSRAPPPVPRRSYADANVAEKKKSPHVGRRAAPAPPAGVPPVRSSGVMLMRKSAIKKGEEDALDVVVESKLVLRDDRFVQPRRAPVSDFIDDDSDFGDGPESNEHSQKSITDSYLDKLSEVLNEELNLDDVELELAELTGGVVANVKRENNGRDYDLDDDTSDESDEGKEVGDDASESVEPIQDPLEHNGAVFVDDDSESEEPLPVHNDSVLLDDDSESVEPIRDPFETEGVNDPVDLGDDASTFMELESVTESAIVDDEANDADSADLAFLTERQEDDDDEDDSMMQSLPPIASEIESTIDSGF